MRYIFWALSVIVVITFSGMLHYTLPQKDIVRITGTEVIRKDFSGWTRLFYSNSGDSGDALGTTRDLRLINARRADGTVMVYRNEDTSLGWPFYFKFDTSNLQAEAEDLISTSNDPKWVMIKHYGWRSTLISIYPNAVKLKVVDGPNKSDMPIINRIPFFNIGFGIVIGLILLGVFRIWQGFRERRIDPAIDVLDEAWEDATRRNVPFGERVKSVFRRDRK